MNLGVSEIASFITAITVIITCVWKVYKLARNVERKLDAYDKNIEQLNLHLNKMALLDTNMPIVDRLHAGEWYLAHGGNGIGKKVYEQLIHDIDADTWSRTIKSGGKDNG